MTKNVIHIYGASGSGTSSLGKYISEHAGYYFMDTDDYFWLPTNPPFQKKREQQERISLMEQDILKHEKVVLSGSLVGWGDALIPFFDLAVFLFTDKNTRIARLKAREKARFASRISPSGDMYQNYCAFIEWAGLYDDGDLNMRSKAKHLQWQTKLLCPCLRLDGGEELADNYQKIKQYLETADS